MRREPRLPKSAERADVWAPRMLGLLLEQDSAWLRLWQDLSRRTGAPRPPRSVPQTYRLQLLRELPALVGVATFLGHTPQTLRTFEQLREHPDKPAAELTLPTRELAQVVRLCLSLAEVQAQREASRAGDLVLFADLLANDLQLAEDGPCRDFDELWSTVEADAVRAEVESVAALVAGLSGKLTEARHRLQVAAAILSTPEALSRWGRTRSGRPRWRQDVARFDLRGHARWLGCASRVEASLGELVAAESLARDAAELFLQARDYFAAGLHHAHLAQLRSWKLDPAGAVEEMELALQLLDLRRSPGLRTRLLVQLSFYLLEAGAPEPAEAELEQARTLKAAVSDFLAGRGLLLIRSGHVEDGLRWLRKARAEVDTGAVRSAQVLSLNLVEAELSLRRGAESARWLEDEIARAGMARRPAVVQERWQQLAAQLRAGTAEVKGVQQLRADVQRSEAFPKAAWSAEGAAHPA